MTSLTDWLNDHPTNRIKVGVTDLDGLLRTKYLSADKLDGDTAEFGFCNVIFGWDREDRLYDNPFDAGFADATARIDPSTRRLIPWEDNLPFVLADFPDQAACPRSLLRRVVERAETLGFQPRFGPELEWFTYRETPASLAEKDYVDPVPLSPGMFGYSGLRTAQHTEYLGALWTQLGDFDVELEGLHTETGPGALEAAIAHRPALEAADRAQLFKQGVREIGYGHGLLASFMAKPAAELPGCGGHLHQSLWREEENVFYNPNGRYGLSAIGENYLAGQLALLPNWLPLFAPNVNSYKRFVAGSWSATRANWGRDNRTVAVRLVGNDNASTRLETRVPGADANPYLAIAGALAAGLYGIENELPLELPPVSGSAYGQAAGEPLPGDLGAAAGAMLSDTAAPDLLGEAFVAHFLRTRRHEWREYQLAVTDWERRRYLESA